MAETLYECSNPQCVLGQRDAPGNFTGGITAEQVNMLTGAPVESLVEGTDFGEGVCPNCGTQGTAVGEHESVVGTDTEAPVEEVTPEAEEAEAVA